MYFVLSMTNSIKLECISAHSIRSCYVGLSGRMHANIAILLLVCHLSLLVYFATLNFSLQHRDEYQKALCVQQEYIVRNNAKLSYCNNRIDI